MGEQGLHTEHASTCADGHRRALEGHWQALILDVALPDGSGIDLCRGLRQAGDATPILMLTARDAIQDRVTGLDAGADDYLVKPFAFAELVARLRALARRPTPLVPDLLTVGDLEIDFVARSAVRAGRELQLTIKEFALLEILARRAGVLVDRPTITAAVWDENHDPFTNVLDVLVRRLRRKLDDDDADPMLETIRGAGYRLRT